MKKILLNSRLVIMLLVSLFAVRSETLTKNYTSYRPYPFCTPSFHMRYPKNADEVVSIVKEAIDRGVKIKALGARHSQTDIICTEGIPVDMNKLKSRQMNADKVTATFGPGVTVREAGEFLFKHGRALRNTAAFGNITLGGAIGTGAHGSTIKHDSTISAQVVQLTVINGHGDKLTISDPDDLKSFKINLGLLGIVVDITLSTVPLYKILAHNYVVSDDVLTNGVALNWARNADQLSFHWFPKFKEVVVANLTFVPVTTPGNARTNIVPPSSDSFNIMSSQINEIAFSLTSSQCGAASALGYNILHVVELVEQTSLWMKVPDHVPYYTENEATFQNPAVGYPHLMFASVCSEESARFFGKACTWAHGDVNANLTELDNEFGIALSDLPAFILTAKDIVKTTPTAFPLQGIVLRFSRKSDVYMSTAYQRDTAHVEFLLWKRSDPYKNPSGSLAGYQTILQTLAHRFKARSHWGKSGLVYHSSDMLDLKLNTFARQQFVAAMDKFDPQEIFINNMGRRIKGKGTKIDFDPLTRHCALLDNCFCSKNSDCGDTQICTSIPRYSYPVCKTKNEGTPKQFNRNEFSKPSHMYNWLLTTVPKLLIGVTANCLNPFNFLH